MDTDEPSAAEPQPQRYGVRELVRAFGRRLVAVECGTVSKSPGPLEAALLWRQVAKAAKAVTSHRTPNSCRLCAEFHHCRPENAKRDGRAFGAGQVRRLPCFGGFGSCGGDGFAALVGGNQT